MKQLFCILIAILTVQGAFAMEKNLTPKEYAIVDLTEGKIDSGKLSNYVIQDK